MEPKYLLPPQARNDEGNVRTLGIELEFAAEDGRQLAELVKDIYQGEVHRIDPHLYKIRDTKLGTFTVELDTQYVHWDFSKQTDNPLMDELLPREHLPRRGRVRCEPRPPEPRPGP